MKFKQYEAAIYLPQQRMELGQQYETDVRTILIDLSALHKAYGEGIATLLVQRPSETEARARATTREGDVLSWVITAADTQTADTGKAVLRWAPLDGGEARSVCFGTIVRPSLRTAEGEVPEPDKGWYESVLAAADAVRSGVDRAENAAKDAEESLQELKEGIASGEFKGEKGDKGDKGEPGEKGEPGADYTLTESDKEEIAGMVEVPVASDTTAGVVKTYYGGALKVNQVTGNIHLSAPSTYGLTIWGNDLGLSRTSADQINNRVAGSTLYAIQCGNLDYAVKAAMCDGKGAAWSDKEKAAALARLGITVDDNGICHFV